MKTKIILVSVLAAITALAGCTTGGGGGTKPVDGTGVAYLSIEIEAQERTRASTEDPGANESDLKTLYLLTFDDTENIVGVPGTSEYSIKIDNATSTPDAVKVSSSATKLLVIANPGTQLLSVINGLNSTTTYSTINAAIVGTAQAPVTKDEITDDVSNITKGFAMINSGAEGENPSVGTKITNPLIDVKGNIVVVTENKDDAAAKSEAEGKRAEIKIERLASKVEMYVKDPADMTVLPPGATFKFGNWTLDAVNSTFYPFATKTLLDVGHSTGGFYIRNFYTQDPNFNNNDNIRYTTVNTTTYNPEIVTPYSWMSASVSATPVVAYCIENTMAAADQLFDAATRVVVKGTYYPNGYGPTGDWFHFAGKDYKNLAELQAAYSPEMPNLKAACDNMYNKIKAFADASGGSITFDADNFSELKETELSQIPNGGELIKNGYAPGDQLIRWYQNGLSYYYYEIRHDNSPTAGEMAFAKYGVVRNNWYQLTLGTIKGAGTPWYPDINNPGPGDPDPKDPIDASAGYLGITVKVAPWILWENDIEM